MKNVSTSAYTTYGNTALRVAEDEMRERARRFAEQNPELIRDLERETLWQIQQVQELERRAEEEEREYRRQQLLERQRLQKQRAIRVLHRVVGKERAKIVRLLCVSVLLVATLFAFALYRQSSLIALNLENNDLKQTIEKTNQEADEMHKKLLATLDLDAIAKQAEQKFGMKEPRTEQVVHLQMTASDRVVYYADQKQNDTSLDTADISIIENYQKQLLKEKRASAKK